ncbi:MAG: hypothetical protein MRK00_06950 [Nitrosomonas sp.]|nr:hypothetical protein [Nitrosomonas sp.]
MKSNMLVVLLCATFMLSQTSWATGNKNNRGVDVAVIKAENATGWNRHLGQVRYEWDFLSADLRTAGANTAGVYNPGHSQPMPITPDTPMDAVLATIVDPDLNIVFPGALDAFPPNPAGINVPLRDVGTWTSGLINHRNADMNAPLVDHSRVTLPFHSEASIAVQAQAEPGSPDPITLGDWLKATGKMKIRCKPDGSAHLRISVSDLIPNRAYTVWAMWHRADGAIFPQPYGGVPNGYITDNNGDAVYERYLNYCPTEAAKYGIEGNRLLSIITHLHSDHILYGAVPTPTATGFPPGTVLHMQLEWNFPGTGVRLID